MNGQTPYSIHTDVKFKPLELIDVLVPVGVFGS